MPEYWQDFQNLYDFNLWASLKHFGNPIYTSIDKNQNHDRIFIVSLLQFTISSYQ